MKLKNMIPMLNISSLETSLEFYREALGFEVVSAKDALDEYRWGVIRSGDTELMLSETDTALNLPKGIDPHHNTDWPVIYYFYPDDVEALYRDVVGKGFKATPLEVTFYGMKEFSLQDPDGHMLSFGQDAEEIAQ